MMMQDTQFSIILKGLEFESSGPLRIYQRMVGCCSSRLLGHLLAILQHAIKYLLRNPKDIKKSLTNQNLDLTQVFRVEYD